MQKFNGLDYFNIESLLSEDEIMIRNSVRELCQCRSHPDNRKTQQGK